MDKKTRILFSLITILVLGIGTLIGIFLVQGNTVDIKSKKVVQTGVLVVNSVPNGAAIYIDEHFTNTTNTSISFLPSKKYKVRLTKEGYIPWEKEINVNNQIIAEVEAILWPATPAPNPITNTGAVNVHVSPDGQKIAYAIRYSEKDKAGLWVMDMAKRTVFSGPSTDFTQITKNTSQTDYSNAKITWSPDSKQILATLQESSNQETRFTRNYLLDITKMNDNPIDETLTKENLLSEWHVEYVKKQNIRASKLNGDPDGIKIASDSAMPLKWSYDETMFMYATSNIQTTPMVSPIVFPSTTNKAKTVGVATSSATATSSASQDTTIPKGNYLNDVAAEQATYSASLNLKVYDVKKKKSYDLPWAKYYTWYPEEEKADRIIAHLVMVEDGSISMIESDGKNKSTIYSGPFEDSLVFPWPDGGRLVFLTNFNFRAGSEPNLYTLNLR